MKTHYTNFGFSQQPLGITDAEGYVEYRENFHSLPAEHWTEAEEWIARQEKRLETWRKKG